MRWFLEPTGRVDSAIFCWYTSVCSQRARHYKSISTVLAKSHKWKALQVRASALSALSN